MKNKRNMRDKNGMVWATPQFVENMKRSAREGANIRSSVATDEPYNPNSTEAILAGYRLETPRRFLPYTVDDCAAFLMTQGIDTVALKKAVSDLMENGKNIILMGPTGTGKSILAAAILKQWNQMHPKYRGAFVHYPFYTMQRRTLRYQELDKLQMTVVTSRTLIILDDVGFADVTWKGGMANELPSAVEHLSTVVSMRSANMNPTVITTNLDEETMKMQYGAMISSRLKEYSHIALVGGDNRGK